MTRLEPLQKISAIIKNNMRDIWTLSRNINQKSSWLFIKRDRPLARRKGSS